VDTVTLAAFQRGDASGVRAVYEQYGRLVYAVAYRVLGQRELAEEAAQQTFVRAWQAADRIDVDRDPAAWLATIAKRVALLPRSPTSRPTTPRWSACRRTSIRSTRCGTCGARSTSSRSRKLRSFASSTSTG
jgi:hypothetical protein